MLLAQCHMHQEKIASNINLVGTLPWRFFTKLCKQKGNLAASTPH
jgi:hypothetical protein